MYTLHERVKKSVILVCKRASIGLITDQKGLITDAFYGCEKSRENDSAYTVYTVYYGPQVAKSTGFENQNNGG